MHNFTIAIINDSYMFRLQPNHHQIISSTNFNAHFNINMFVTFNLI